MLAAPVRADEIGPRVGRHPLEYVAIFSRRWYIVAALALGLAAVAGIRALITRPVYRAVTVLAVDRYPLQILEFRDVVQFDGRPDEYYLTQLKLLRSRRLALQVVEKLNLAGDPEFAATASVDRATEALMAKLEVRRQEQSQLVTVAFEAHRPELAAQVANEVAAQYIDESSRARAEPVAQATSWLAGQIEDQRGKVEVAGDALQSLKRREGIEGIDERRGLLDQRLKQLGGQLNDKRAERLHKEALYREMATASNSEELPTVIGNRVVQELRVDLLRLERREAELLGRLLDQHPEVVKVRSEIADTRRKVSAEAQRILKATENDYLAAVAQERSLAQELDATRAEAEDLTRRSLRYDTLKRELEASQTVLNSVLTRSKQMGVAKELRLASARVIDPANAPRRPVRPRPLRDVLLALLLGTAAGAGVVILLDRLDTTLRTPRDVRQHLGLPLLAVIPDAATQANGHPVDAAEGPLTEGYRVLRAALDHSGGSERCRVVSIVATAPREGKTLTAVNVALALAARGEQVLLLDGDLRQPQAHERLRAPRAPGLTDVLEGRYAPQDAIQEVDATGLRLLPSGSPSGRGANLLRPSSLKALLEALRERFEWVVVDTPPMGAVPDGLTFASMSDAVVLVVRAEMTQRAAVTRTLERLAAARAPVTGALLNGARVDRYPHAYAAHIGDKSGQYAPAGRETSAPELAEAVRPPASSV